MPIIELQRRMVEAGRIRAGDFGDGRPRKLDKWRLTSKDRQRLELAASLWGGEVREWEGRAGEFELYTDTASLPIMLLPGHEPTTWYELWSKGGCQRRCDGQHEIISDSSCLCGEERECKPTTRLSVMLPDLPGLGSWVLSSTGWNAAAELAGAADLLQRASAQGVLIPARLRLEQRVQVKGGQTRRFSVPVIDLDISMRELLGNQGALSAPSEQRALPSGYTPIAGNGGNGVSLSDGLVAAETQQKPSSRTAPIPIPDDDIPFGDGPVLVEGDAPPAPGNTVASSTREKPATKAQRDKLNVLVGKLREAGTIQTRHLWGKLAIHRYALDVEDRDVVHAKTDEMIELLKGVGEDGELHWSPLRDSLNRGEASMLIDALEALGA